MGTMKKLMTLFRGQVRQGAEALVDANALALLDQQLFDTEQTLIGARRDLAALMAERKLLQVQAERTCADIARYEGYTREALARDEAALAQDTAVQVADMEDNLSQVQAQLEELAAREREFRGIIERAGQALGALRQQQAVARVSDRIHDVSGRVGDGGSSLQARLAQSEETLARIQARQARARALWQAHGELEQVARGDALQQRLEQAGIVRGRQQRAAEVLARIQAAEPLSPPAV